jgi:hypothetical protein
MVNESTGRKPVTSFDLLGAVEESLPCRAAA